ncbi:hypothetical protein IJ182_09950 [bacterium]|nr:hypothetical protein [bacterium]
MNITSPTRNTTQRYKNFKQFTNPNNRTRNYNQTQSFKGDPTTLITQADEKVLNVFKQYYGNVAGRMGTKLATLITPNEKKSRLLNDQAHILSKKARYRLEDGVSKISDKNILTSIKENLIFPFITLPSYFGSWVLEKAQKVPSLRVSATKLRNQTIFRVPRKINDMDAMTDSLKGIYDKTKQLATSFAEEKGLSPDNLLELLNKPAEKLSEAEKPLVKEAGEFIQEGLYKVSNKFFDKHTGNFNTAYERPLNRIVTGLIPVAFLANDAYNLSVLCGDKKEDSVKEANTRKKQEISRVFTTAYIQLLTYGAFTKLVNTKPWFATLTSAVTVLFSEISARKRLNRPIMFLSKEAAKEYNRKNNTKDIKKDETPQRPQIKNVSFDMNNAEPKVFTSFKAGNGTNLEDKGKDLNKKKEEPKKALINFQTFKKGVGILLAAGFALSFIKNSSFTKDTKLVKGLKSIGEKAKERIYNPLAFKKFEMQEETFNEITNGLKKADCGKIAKGHEFIKGRYAETVNGIVRMYKAVVPSGKIPNIVEALTEKLPDLGISLSDKEMQSVSESIEVAIKTEGTNIAEKKFDKVAQKAVEIMTNKNVGINEEQAKGVTEQITGLIEKFAEKEDIMIDTKAKPFVDMVTQPFKFIGSVLAFPFKKIATPLINIATSGIEKKAQKAALGKAELTTFEKAIHRAVTEIYGEKGTKTKAISQEIFVNAMEQLDKQTLPYRTADKALQEAIANNAPEAEIEKLRETTNQAKEKLRKYVNTAVEKSFNGVTQSSNKNTDLAMMTKLASSTVTSAFLVADNYNMVMLKSDGEDKEGAKEKANERIIQRLSALFYQTMLINWFNATFRSTYNSSLKGMTAVAIPNTLTTEVLTRKSIGMPLGRKTLEELNAIDEKNEKRTGFLGKYFKFMRLLTGKKPLKDRLPKDKQKVEQQTEKLSNYNNISDIDKAKSTNLLELLAK